MNAKRKTTTPATKTPKDPGTVRIRHEPGKTSERILADAAAQGTLGNAHVMATFAKPMMGELHLDECVSALCAKAGAVNRGDLSSAESILIEQAAALNAIFGELSRRAAMIMGEYRDATDRYTRLALKAQIQCRATLETLATVKAGPAIFVRQAHIPRGPQQVSKCDAANNSRAEVAKTREKRTGSALRIEAKTLNERPARNPQPLVP